MTQYEFSLILSVYPTDEQVERVGAFIAEGGDAPASVLDVTLGQSSGVPYAECTVEAATLDEAIGLVLNPLREMGLSIEHVEVPVESL